MCATLQKEGAAPREPTRQYAEHVDRVDRHRYRHSIRSIDIDIATAEGQKQPHPKLPEIEFQMDDSRFNSIPRQLLNIAHKAREALLADGPQPTDPPSDEEEQSEEQDGEREEELIAQQVEHNKKRKRRGGQKHVRGGAHK